MPILDRERSYLDESAFAHRLWPVAYCENGIYLLSAASLSKTDKEDYLGFCFIGEPLCGIDESTRRKLQALFAIPFPPGAFLHAMLYASPDIEHELDGMMRLRAGADDLLLGAVGGRRDYVEACSRRPQSRVVHALARDFVFELDVKVPCRYGADGRPTEEALGEVLDLQQSVAHALQNIGLGLRVADPNRLLRFYGTLVNWSDEAAWRLTRDLWDMRRPLRYQIKDGDVPVHLTVNSVVLGEKHARVVTPRKLPEDHELWTMPVLLGDQLTMRGIPQNVAYSLVAHFPEPVATKALLEKKHNIVKYQSFGPMLKWFPEIARRKEAFDLLHSALAKGDNPVQIFPSILLFADTEAELSGAASNLKTYLREHNWIMQDDHYIQGSLFLSSLPFGGDRAAIPFLSRYGTVAGRHAAEFMPVAADWKGTGTPALTLFSRNQQIMSFDLYNSNSNFNAVVAAQSGSGKSFLSNEIILSYLSMGALFFVIDVGRSYKNLCEEMGGLFMEFSADSGVRLNPFSLVNDFKDEGETLVGVLIAMAQESTALSDRQLAALRRVISDVWDDKGRQASIDDVEALLLRSDDSRVRDVGHQLYPFTSRGVYGHWFRGESTLDFTNPFVVLELDELKGQPALQRVVLMMLIYKIQNIFYLSGTERRKFLIIDEAWEMLSHPSIAKFIESGYRKFRKTRGSAIVITQSVEDLYASDSGRAIAQNSAFKLLLGQTPEAVGQLKDAKRIAVSDWGFELLCGVHTHKGEYSEIFIHSQEGAGVGRLIVSPFSRLLYSTDPDDRNAIAARTRTGMTTAEAIRDILAHGR